MRAVLDTNVVVSGLLYAGKPQLLLQKARHSLIELYTSDMLLVELHEVVERHKFARKIELLRTTPSSMIVAYLAIVNLVSVSEAKRVVVRDHDDDEVIACAVAANADFVITGDRHLLEMGRHHEIQIITVSDALDRIADESASEE